MIKTYNYTQRETKHEWPKIEKETLMVRKAKKHQIARKKEKSKQSQITNVDYTITCDTSQPLSVLWEQQAEPSPSVGDHHPYPCLAPYRGHDPCPFPNLGLDPWNDNRLWRKHSPQILVHYSTTHVVLSGLASWVGRREAEHWCLAMVWDRLTTWRIMEVGLGEPRVKLVARWTLV